MTDPRIERLTEMVTALRQEGYNRQESIELLYARIEALEAAQQPEQDSPPPQKQTELELEEILAQIIYEQAIIPTARHCHAEAPEWVVSGNSIAQDDACATARAIIRRWPRGDQPQQLDQSLAPPIGVKPQWLVDEQRLGDLEAAIKRREDRGVPVLLDWVIEVCEIRDRQKERRKGRGLREKVDLIVQVEEQYGQQPAPTGNDSLTDAPPAPDDRLRWCPTHGQQPRNAWGCPECVRELRDAAAPPAPAGGLVELIRDELGHHGTASANAVIRKVATWLRSELISRAAADRLDQEANR